MRPGGRREAGAAAIDAAGLEAAVGLHQAGRLDEAEAAYRRLIGGPPSTRRAALPFLAVLLRQRDRPREALEVYDRLVAMGERSAALFATRGDLLQGLGRSAEALQSYDHALATLPGHEAGRAEILNNRGAVLIALGRPQAALANLEAAVRLRPDYGEALYNRGVAQDDLGDRAAALASYDAALAAQPDHRRALNNRALIAAEDGRPDAALVDLDRALALDRTDVRTWVNRSAVQRRLGRPEAALEDAEQALALGGETADGLNARGLALAAVLRFEAALADYDRALVLEPGHVEALNNSGVALVGLGRIEAALARYDAALARNPAFAEAEYNSGLALLRLGRAEAGWRRHEARRRRRGQPGPLLPSGTLWLGEEPIAGLTLLVHAEQGLGDTLQFCRYVPEVAALGARVTLQAPRPLVSLLDGLDGVAQAAAIGDATPPFDRHIPMMSLPLALQTAGRPEPPAAAYLKADPGLVQAWSARLGARNRMRIGLVWAGNPAHENDRNRSIPLEMLAARIAAGRTLVSLQTHVSLADAAWIAQRPDILRVDEHLTDFAQTAAAIAALDLVITVDTSVAHLAGALGRPVWILVPSPSDWRWGLPPSDGSKTYELTAWYPSARIYRQRRSGDWDEVISRVASDLGAADPGSDRPRLGA